MKPGVFEASGMEWCWYQANHDSDTALLSDAIEQTVDGFISSVVEELPRTEAILLTKAAGRRGGGVRRGL